MRNPFEGVKSMQEIYAVKKQLLKDGIDKAEVNRLVSEKRHQLAQLNREYKVLKKVVPDASILRQMKVTTLSFNFDKIESGRIEVTKDGVIHL